MVIRGIDVSKYCGYINWEEVKNDGIKFVIIRGGYGSYTVDENFEYNIKGAIQANIDIGIYWFSYATSDDAAKLEALKCISTISPYKDKITYPVFYDFEYDSVRYANSEGVSINKSVASSYAETFLTEIKNEGYIPGIYTNANFSSIYFSENIMNEYDLWIAQYASRCTYNNGNVDIWQYSDTGRVSGINTDVDLNYCYKDYTNSKSTNSNRNDNNHTNRELVKSLQIALNESYDCNLVEDGLFGPNTKRVVREHPLSIALDYEKLEHTMWLQRALDNLGYNLAIDGYYGPDTRSVVIKYQESKDIEVDGIAGIQTHEAIISYIQ